MPTDDPKAPAVTMPTLPPRRVPGWLYAFLVAVFLGAYVALVLTGHSTDTSSILLIFAPLLGSVFVADRVSGTARAEGQNTRQAITNGALTAGLLNALDHPLVIEKLGGIVAGILTQPGPHPAPAPSPIPDPGGNVRLVDPPQPPAPAGPA